MSKLSGQMAFDNVLDRLLKEQASNALNRSEVVRLSAQLQEQTIQRGSAQALQKQAQADLQRIRENYEKLKKLVPRPLLEKHEIDIGDIPF